MTPHRFQPEHPGLTTVAPFCGYAEAIEGVGIRKCLRPALHAAHIRAIDLCQWCIAREGRSPDCRCRTDCGLAKCPARADDFDFRSIPVPTFIQRKEPA